VLIVTHFCMPALELVGKRMLMLPHVNIKVQAVLGGTEMSIKIPKQFERDFGWTALPRR
jgi:hypothetical protein